ncbi:Elongation factor 2 [Pyrenophora tritici-repentis]|nr:Elongation factor 2 [Pyrenophora tritici-repentis]
MNWLKARSRGLPSCYSQSQKSITYPETLHHLVLVNTEFLSIPVGELADGESPAVKTGTKGNGTLLGVDLDITKSLVEVGSDDDVDGLDDTGEVLVQVLLGKLELEKSTVDLVDDDDGLDTLTKSLAQDSLGLDAHTFDGVDDDESTVSDTESSSDLR